MATEPGVHAIVLRLERALADLPGASTPAETAAGVLRAVRAVIVADGGALVLMDPQTRLFTTGAVDELPAPSCHPFFRYEMESSSRRTFRRLAATGRAATALSLQAAPGDQAEADRLVDVVLAPHGFSDEVRVVCRDGGNAWGAVSLWRRAESGPFSR